MWQIEGVLDNFQVALSYKPVVWRVLHRTDILVTKCGNLTSRISIGYTTIGYIAFCTSVLCTKCCLIKSLKQ